MTVNLPALGLPVEETFDALKSALSTANNAVLEAPPGAGKTTLVPLCLLNEPWLVDKKIIMLEPRRLAARMAAQRMADILGENVGQTVGYRIRQDKKVSAQTRIEVVTEGILTRRLQSDPELDGVGLVIFDEYHERSLQGDLGLAFCLETQDALRDDLRLLVMSATLDGATLSDFLGDAPRITSQGRMFDVETRFLPRPDKFNLSQDTAQAILKAITQDHGSILAFLPGEGEIRKTQSILEDKLAQHPDIIVAPLYGALPPKEQDIAISPAKAGQRKIVLATTIAETSLTIEGIRIVVDCGYKRVARFDNARAMSRMETVRVSKASAQQRRGRAGRLEKGICYRLWPQEEDNALLERDLPEILDCDLAPFALELATWGVTSPRDLRFIDYPSEPNFIKAQNLLRQLDALDKEGRITPHGKDLSTLSLHPRIAHMVLKAAQHCPEDGALACTVAAVLHDGPLLKGVREADLRNEIALMDGKATGPSISKGALHRARETVRQLKQKLKIPSHINPTSYLETGRLLALAYPDRIAKQRSNAQADYHLSSGMGASLRNDDVLSREPYLVIAHMDAANASGRIFSAAPLSLEDIERDFSSHIQIQEEIGWDKRQNCASARKVKKLGALVLAASTLNDVDPTRLGEALCAGIRQSGLHVLPWDKDCENLRQRMAFMHTFNAQWPDVSDRTLSETLENWLLPFLSGCSRFEHLKKIDLKAALTNLLDWDAQQRLNDLAPTHYVVPSGSAIRLDYSNAQKPVLAVKLQEMFGQPQTPTINAGQCAVQIHLLSPAGRPLQVTEDLASFWNNAYDSVKKEMRGRYPKHPWPDNPLEARATGKTKRHLA